MTESENHGYPLSKWCFALSPRKKALVRDSIDTKSFAAYKMTTICLSTRNFPPDSYHEFIVTWKQNLSDIQAISFPYLSSK